MTKLCSLTIALLLLTGIFVGLLHNGERFRYDAKKTDSKITFPQQQQQKHSFAGSRVNIIVDDDGGQNYATIQAAIDNATPGDIIYIWAGTYNENVVVNKTVTLIGNRSADTIIDGGGNGDVVYISVSWVNITGFNITNSGGSGGDAGIQLYYAEYCNIVKNNCSNNNYGIYLENSSNNTIANNTCDSNNLFGIYTVSSYSNNIVGNTCNSNDYHGIYVRNYNITSTEMSCSFEETLTNEWTTYSSNGLGRIIRTDLHDPLSGLYHLQMDVNSGWQYNLNELVYHHQGSSEVYLGFSVFNMYDETDYLPTTWSGHYNGDGISVSRDGTNWSGIWQGPGAVEEYSSHMINLSSYHLGNDYYIKFQQYGKTSVSNDGIFWDDISLISIRFGNVIVNNNCSHNQEIGIFISQSFENDIRDNICVDNKYGMKLTQSNNNQIKNNTCNSNGWQWGGTAIWFENSGGNNINNNNCSSNHYLGIVITYSSSNILTNNTCNSNGVYGIYAFQGNHNNIFVNNTCNNNPSGIFITGLNHLIINNNCSSNRDDGIQLWGESDPIGYILIANNTCNSNGRSGMYIFGSRRSTIVDNICNFNLNGIYIDGDAEPLGIEYHSEYNVITRNICNENKENGIYLYVSSGDMISDNEISLNSVNGIYLSYSRSSTFNGNAVSENKGYGLKIAGGYFYGSQLKHSIHNNTFVSNNGGGAQGYDNTPYKHDWDDSNEAGNYWFDYQFRYPSASNNGVVWNVSYSINGGTNIDDYPLVFNPNDKIPPSLDRDDSLEFGNTGDKFALNITVSDDFLVNAVYVNWSHGGLSENTSLNNTGVCWCGNITLDNNINRMTYTIYVSDSGNNYYISPLKNVTVIDNDNPILEVDYTPNVGTTGDSFQFNTSASDNIDVDTIYMNWTHGSSRGNKSLSLTNGYWLGIITLEDNLDDLKYIIYINDTSNLYNISSEQTAMVTDNDNPILDADNSLNSGTTGDNYVFNVTISDNIAVDEVWVNWTHGGLDWNLSTTDNGDDTWSRTVVLDHSVADLNYFIWFNDTSGNPNKSGIMAVTVIDNDPPEFLGNATIEELVAGKEFTFSARFRDNTLTRGLAFVYVNYSINGMPFTTVNMQPASGSHHWNATVNIPTNGTTMLYYFIAQDSAGNRISTYDQLSEPEEIRDITPPTIDTFLNITIDQHERVDFNGTGCLDNVFIVNYIWTFTYEGEKHTLMGSEVDFTFHIPGIYFVRLYVTDASGNWNAVNITLVVLDITPPVANAGVNRTIDQGTNITFNSTGTTDIVGVVSYEWSLEYDGARVALKGASPSFVFNIAGMYWVTLAVEDAAGNGANDTLTVTVNPVYSLTVNVDPPNAVVKVDGQVIIPVNGTLILSTLAPGIYIVNVTRDGYYSKQENVNLTGGLNISFRLVKMEVGPEPLTLRIGPFFDEDGETVPGVNATLTLEGVSYNGTADTSGVRFDLTTDAVGKTVRVKVTASGYENISFSGTVLANGTLNAPAFEKTAVPDDGKDETKESFLSSTSSMIFLVIALLLIILLIIIFLLLRKRKKEEEEEEDEEDEDEGDEEEEKEEEVEEGKGEAGDEGMDEEVEDNRDVLDEGDKEGKEDEDGEVVGEEMEEVGEVEEDDEGKAGWGGKKVDGDVSLSTEGKYAETDEDLPLLIPVYDDVEEDDEGEVKERE